MKDNATPIYQKPRWVPYLLTQPLQKRLKEFQQNDIIEQTPDHMVFTFSSTAQTKESKRHSRPA